MIGLLCAGLGLAAAAAEPKPVKVAVGQEFELVLDSPPGAGSEWLLSEPLDAGRIQQLGRSYRRRMPSGGKARGWEVLRYRALAEGKTQIHLKYASAWQENSQGVLKTNVVVVITNAPAK